MQQTAASGCFPVTAARWRRGVVGTGTWRKLWITWQTNISPAHRTKALKRGGWSIGKINGKRV